MANIFPERDAGCKVRLRREEDRATKACRSGLSANNSDLIRQVITLEGLFGDTEDSMPGVTLLVCVVAIGQHISCEGFLISLRLHGLTMIQ